MLTNKIFRPLALLLMALMCVPASAFAHSRHHGGARVGVYVGVPLAIGASYYYGPRYHAPAYYPAPVYYYRPAPVIVVPAPVTYVEQHPTVINTVSSNAPSSAVWHYCDASKSYYPYVKDCPGGWQQVSPTPAR